MIINSLLIKNFGIYYGSYLFDLKPHGKNNIILIGGENGAGKTTLLNSIKFSLYGPLMLGLKYAANSHINVLRQKYYNNKAFDLKEPCIVEINFSLIQDGYKNQYRIERGMLIIKGDIKLTTNIFKNDTPLNKKEVLDFEDYIRRFMSPSIFEFFFFDGEKISEVFNNENYTLHLNESAKSLFNIDIFETLQEDINLYLAQDNVFKTLTNEQQRYTELNAEKNIIEESINIKNNQNDYLKNEVLELKKITRTLEEDFKINGGLLEKERTELNSEINQLEHERKILNQNIREYVTDILPLSIPRLTLLSLAEQLRQEIDMQNSEIIKEKLSPTIFKEVLQRYVDENGITSEDLDALPDFLYNYIKDAVTPDTKESKILHNLSKSEADQIIGFINSTITCNHTLPQVKYSRIEKINKKLSFLRQQFKSSMENHRLDDLIDSINKNNSQIIENEGDLVAKTSELKELELSLEQIDDEIKAVQNKLVRAIKDENVFNIAQKIGRVIESYKYMMLSKRNAQIEEYFFEMFLKLIRKDSFIKEVSFDAATYNIILYNKDGHKFTKDSFSAGEIQIYILSFIWAIINTSKREFPLVFDTLLGRLDLAHKHNIIHNLLPNAGKQVIILSTNTEITLDSYKQLKQYVAKEYLLTFDSEAQQVTVDNKYFFEIGE